MVRRFVFFTLIATSTLACSKSPEQICSKFEELEAKSDKKDKKVVTKEDREKCKKDLLEMKEASPNAYSCVGVCADQSTNEAASGCMLLCVMGDEKLKAREEEKEKKAEAERAEKLVKVVDLPMKSVDGVIKSYEGKEIKYSLSLADGFAEDKTIAADSMKTYELKVEELIAGPTVTIMPSFQPDLDNDVKMAAELKEKVVKKEKTERGHILSTEGEGMLKAEVVVQSGKSALSCKATFFGDKAVEKKEKILPWLEKLCGSLTIK